MDTQPKYVIDFVFGGVPSRRYDASTPEMVFSACLAEFSIAHKQGKFKNIGTEIKVQEILDILSIEKGAQINQYRAGKLSYQLLKNCYFVTLWCHKP